MFLSFLKLFPASLGVYLSSSFYPPETIRWIQKIQMLALCRGVHGFLAGTCAKLLTFNEAVKTTKTLLFLSFCAPSGVCSDSPLACLLVLSSSSFLNLATPADVNTVNCHLPVLVSAGHFFISEKIKIGVEMNDIKPPVSAFIGRNRS